MPPVFRLIRAAAFAAVCVLVSAGGHLFAGGGAISPIALGLGFGVPYVLALVVNGRERSRESVLVATSVVQLVLHQVFARVAPVAELDTGHGHLNVGMTMVHLTVALLSGWWLHQGEQAVWTALRLWGVAPLLLLFAAPVPVEAGVGLWRAVPCDRVGVWRSPVFTRALRRRGPPGFVRAV
ncbi:MFS transporter [Nonomuraea longicatena]|uniref:MFS transporter n=1 Tax=Nonomuraea longicatena TaxID=83682 RepID=A0ABN1NUC6_9ACTN